MSGRILIVDDEPELRDTYAEILRDEGHEVMTAGSGTEATAVLRCTDLDAVLSDIMMAGMDGLQLLRVIRQSDLDVPVILMTGSPAVETAAAAVEHGALRYLLKPIRPEMLAAALRDAVRLGRLARAKREALVLLGRDDMLVGDRAGLEGSLDRALCGLHMAYQPIVRASGEVFGYETLARTAERTLPHPGALFHAAERLGRMQEVGRAARDAVARTMRAVPDEQAIFVNIHASDLTDEALFTATAPLASSSARVVVEITERAALEQVANVRSRIRALRAMGFRIALDDLGAGYAGLTSFALVEPEIVKLDMALIRDVDREPLKRRLIESIQRVCAESGILVVAEGVETEGERDTVVGLGCDLLQGYFLGRPGPPPASVVRAA